MTVCVFASSSSKINSEFAEAASHLGTLFARAGINVVYGGGGIGLMRHLADAVISENGKITGVIPGFMMEAGWNHPDITDMIVTSDMGERKKRMFSLADSVVALPGGIGTLEELTEAITLRQLGLFKGPIVVLNTSGYYRHFIDFLDHMVKGNFMRFEHKGIWEVVNTPEEVLVSLEKRDDWYPDPRSIAKI